MHSAIMHMSVLKKRPDLTAPVLQSITHPRLTPTKIIATYDESLDTASIPASSAYTIVNSGGADNVTGISVVGKTVEITKSRTSLLSDSLTLSYTIPGSSPVQDVSGNDAPSFSSQAVIRSIKYDWVHDTASHWGPVWGNGEPWGFKDNGGSGSLVVLTYTIGGGGELKLKYSTNFGKTWVLMTPSATLQLAPGDPSFFIQSAAQDSSGKIHILYKANGIGLGYARCTMTRDGSGNPSDLSIDVTGIAINQGVSGGSGWGNNDLKGMLRVLTIGGTERVVICTICEYVAGNHNVYASASTTMTPSASSSFVGMSGTGSFTSLWDAVGSPHTMFAGFAQVTSNGDLIFYRTQIPAESTWGNCDSLRVPASGTFWGTPGTSTTRRTNGMVMTSCSTVSNVWWFVVTSTGGIRVDRFDSSGTYTQDVITAPGSTSGVQIFLSAKVSSDGSRAYLIWQAFDGIGSAWETKAAYWNGSSWDVFTLTLTSANGDTWGVCTFEGWDDGVVAILADTTDNTLWLSTVYSV